MNSVFRGMLKACYRIEAIFDKRFLALDVPMSKTAGHNNWQSHLREIGNRPGMKILEVGSREVGASSSRQDYSESEGVT